MLDKFTERARKVLSFARQAAHVTNSEFIGTEHLLLGIIEEGGGVAYKTLKLCCNSDLQPMLAALQIAKGPSLAAPRPLAEIPFTPRAKRVMELAGEEVAKGDAKWMGTEHIILGLFLEREGPAAEVLRKFGITENILRKRVQEVLGEQAGRIEGPTEGGPEQARQRLVEIQKRIVTPSHGAMRVWLFLKDIQNAPDQGTLVYRSEKMGVAHIVFLDGVPFEKRESIAASIAKDCGALAYLIEPYQGIKYGEIK